MSEPRGIPLIDDPPDGLVWHYTDGTGVASIVANHVLWATASAFLNDAHEVELGYQRIREELTARARGGDAFAESLLARVADSSREVSGPSPGVYFILSTAQGWDLLAMWRCYGGRGESYAVGLDPTVPLRILSNQDSPVLDSPDDVTRGQLIRLRAWTPVRYAAADQQALVAAVFDGLPEDLAIAHRLLQVEPGSAAGSKVLDALSETLDDLEQALVLIKHDGFHDEREIRHSTALIHPDGVAGFPGVVRYRPTAYGMAPYLWLTGSAPDSPSATVTAERTPLPIRAVAISPSPNGPAAEQSLRSMLGAHGYDVEILRSRIPFRG